MSCTHDCGCTPEIRDARTDEWVQIAPESARAATLTPERPVKAPGQDGDVCAPQEPVLPRRIKPEDVRVGMVVERRKDEAAHRDRVQHIDDERIVGTDGAWLWVPGNADGGWTLWLIEDAPEPEDPDAEAVEVGTLRAQVAAVEALVNNGQTVGWIERDGDAAWIAADAIRAALATTGEGE